MPQFPPEYFFPMLGMAFALAWGGLATFRWYVKEKLRISSGAGGSGEQAARVAALEERIGELEERVDFAERLLAQHRESGRLGPGT
ncbi:MAG TPA: hypothetical protein VD793_04265 [Gemmatimonadales bacterium]|nr:hypothetical protein [Gemmatimonadales bacterium]